MDLSHYREKVRDAVLRLENLPIQMETFSALPGQPVRESTRMAAEADAVICIVAHRYGYIPPKALGGDGERSITWLEVDAAKRAGKPVYAFLIDSKAPWTGLKEQDRLISEPDRANEVVGAVRKLQDFKAYLERECTRSTFNNADDLATQVTAALARFVPQPGHTAPSTARVWRPLFCHGLQPAKHFRGREDRVRELREWLEAPTTRDRVISIVAAGGTGKTALVEKVLRESSLPDRAGLFVWSFYEDPRTDEFIRDAYFYFTGEREAPTGGMLERLQLALGADAPHVLVLDGVEQIQSEGALRPRGELKDLQLKRVLRSLAGGTGNARALVTSRFPLVDLDEWTGAGHRPLRLDDLQFWVAIDVLRDWRVVGDDAKLARLLAPLNLNPLEKGGAYHALSIVVLGSYLGNFAGGDPSRAAEFSLEHVKGSDSKGRRLSHILEQYAKALTSVERDILSRLSLFPRGIKVQVLAWIAQSSRRVAGDLAGLNEQQLTQQLDRLRTLGLAFRSDLDQPPIYSAHPFLREFFCNLLGAEAKSVHESVRVRLARQLKLEPQTHPKEPRVLDQYEFLIEQTILADRVREAFDLYWSGLGNYRNLSWVLGENGRGLRTLEHFITKDNLDEIARQLLPREQSRIVNDLGLYAKNLGDLVRARRTFAYGQRLSAMAFAQEDEAVYARNLAEVELAAGNFQQAIEHSKRAVFLTSSTNHGSGALNSLSWRAMSHFVLGNVAAAIADLQQATKLFGKTLCGIPGIMEAECGISRGNRSDALRQSQANWQFATANSFNEDLCRCNSLLARLLLSSDVTLAGQRLQESLRFANHSGHVELQLRCFQAACDLRAYLGDFGAAIKEGEAGILLADTCGFGRFSIDLRLILAETLLAAGEFRSALQSARSALERSEHPDCQYAWGKADGLHFSGIAHLRLGETEPARQRLTGALELRERLGHGRIEETRRALASLPPLGATST